MVIRPATDDDWPGIWRFLCEIVRAGERYTWECDIAGEDARVRWFTPRPGRTVVAIDEYGTVVGSARLVPNQLGPGAYVANASFMVDPARGGSGIGRALAERVLAIARDDGYQAMPFNAVVETNTVAVTLWRSLGFEIVTTVPEAFGHPTHGVGLHIMYRRL